MKYQQLQPPDYLQAHLRYYWTLECDAPGQQPHTFAPLADGCPGIIYQQSDTGVFFDREGATLPRIFLYGQTIRPAEICLMGRFRMIGACLMPDALKSVFGFYAFELTDTCTDLDPVAAKQGMAFSEQLLNTATIPGQLELLSVFLAREIGKHSNRADALTRYALNLMQQSGGSVTLKELQHTIRLSERSFQRKFSQDVGISPKLFSKVCRFQTSLAQLKNNSYSKLSDIAYDNGYADQSHFIRSFKEFAGYAPYEFRKQSDEVVNNFPLLRK